MRQVWTRNEAEPTLRGLSSGNPTSPRRGNRRDHQGVVLFWPCARQPELQQAVRQAPCTFQTARRAPEGAMRKVWTRTNHHEREGVAAPVRRAARWSAILSIYTVQNLSGPYSICLSSRQSPCRETSPHGRRRSADAQSRAWVVISNPSPLPPSFQRRLESTARVVRGTTVVTGPRPAPG